MRRWTLVVLAGLLGAGPSQAAGAASTPAAATTEAKSGFAAFIAALRPDAKARGVTPRTFSAAFAGISGPDPDILARKHEASRVLARAVRIFLRTV